MPREPLPEFHREPHVFQVGHEEIAVGQRFGSRTVGVIGCVDQVDVQFLTESTVARPSKREKVSVGVVERCPEYNLL